MRAPGPTAPGPAPGREPSRHLAAAFRDAARGVVDALVRQRNMRLHAVAALLVGLAGGALPLGAAEELALLLCVALVLAAEVLNTGLEALVDLYTREIDPNARVAKDSAAGAVLVLAAGAVLALVAVVARAWPAIAAAPARLLVHAALSLPLAACAALLVFPFRRPAAADAAFALAGAALLAVLLPRFTSLPMALLAVVAFALCAIAAVARRRGA